MAIHYFIWNGTNSKNKHIRVPNRIPIIKPEERTQQVMIPGRSGDLTETEGENIYNSYIQTVSISVKGGFNVRNIYKWLRGSGYVIFSGEPDRKQAARVIGAITLNRVSRNIDHWAGEVQFYCQPFKEKLLEEMVSVTSSGATVKNDGDVIAYPKITVNAGAAGQDIVLAMGGKVLRINMTGMADTGCVVDCQGQVVTNYSGTANLTHLSSGEFPRLLPGDNTVTYVNASSLDIEKRERFL